MSASLTTRSRGALAALGIGVLVLGLPLAGSAASKGFKQVNLVSDQPGVAAVTDPDLVNPWGVAFFPGNHPFWVSDNHSGKATLYDPSTAAKQGLVVTIPAPGGGQGAPTGQVANADNTKFKGDLFIFDTEDGTIVGWQGADGTTAVIQSDQSATGAIYKGLAIATTGQGARLYAADFHNAKVDVFDSDYNLVDTTGKFTDPHPIAGYAPFNIHVFGTQLFVAYAKQDAAGEDDEHGAGNGFIDIYTLDGTFVRRFASGTHARGRLTQLNSPWGMAKAPAGFGSLSNRILVGNFGSGQIAAFDAKGKFKGFVTNTRKRPIRIDGLWEIFFGAGGTGDPKKLYFTAGPDDETHGLFGVLQVARKKKGHSSGGGGPY